MSSSIVQSQWLLALGPVPARGDSIWGNVKTKKSRRIWKRCFRFTGRAAACANSGIETDVNFGLSLTRGSQQQAQQGELLRPSGGVFSDCDGAVALSGLGLGSVDGNLAGDRFGTHTGESIRTNESPKSHAFLSGPHETTLRSWAEHICLQVELGT